MSEFYSLLSNIMVISQVLIGLLIVKGAVMLLAFGVDSSTNAIQKCLVIGLLCWGTWFSYIGFIGEHDSPPALAFGAAVAFIVLKYGRQIRGLIEGEKWWPKKVIKEKYSNSQDVKGGQHEPAYSGCSKKV
jgi:hypothetical protein